MLPTSWKALYSSTRNMHASLTLVIITIVIALLFDFLNGFHDAANSIAAIVSDSASWSRTGLFYGCVFNFIAFAFLA